MDRNFDIVSRAGEHVDLCVKRVDDEAIETYLRWMNDETINMWISHNYYVTQWYNEKSWVEKEYSDNDCMWNIVEKSTRKLIGNCGCRYDGITSSLGICIGEAEGRDKGYGTEVIKMLIDFAFKEQNAHRVELMANGDNARALKCYKKAGFRECGRKHDANYYNGMYSDTVIMEILKEDWKLNNPPEFNWDLEDLYRQTKEAKR